MTLPIGPPISFAQIAAELGISSTALNISSTAARALAGVPSGTIAIRDFYGKSVSMSVAVADQSSHDGSGVGSFAPTAAVSGGTAPYTYSWAVTGTAGLGSYSLTSATANPCTLSISPASPFSSPGVVGLQCTVTDAHGVVASSNIANFAYSSP